MSLTLNGRISPIGALSTLESDWQALWDNAGKPFFLSWAWARAIIDTTPDKRLFVFHAHDDTGALRALALLGQVNEIRHRIVKIDQLRLNEAGLTADSTVPNEDNGLLCAPTDADAAARNLLNTLANPAAPRWDELVVSNAVSSLEDKFSAAAPNLNIYRRGQSDSYLVDLEALRANGVATLDEYLAQLGKSTRSQIRRAIRLYEDRGPLTIRLASTLEEAQQFFRDLAALHERKWAARGQAGLISDTSLRVFHEQLLANGFAAGHVQLLSVHSGDTAIGWLYNFVDRGAALYYLGGFAAEDDNRLKPGLVTQALAVEYYLANGYRAYDFMMGYDRYKENMGQQDRQFTSFALQRPRLKLRLEALGRRLKSRLHRA